jgi:hypothetical protein
LCKENIFPLCCKSKIGSGNTFPFRRDKQNKNVL